MESSYIYSILVKRTLVRIVQLERWSVFRVSFDVPKQSVSPKKEVSLKQSHPQVPSYPAGGCELASWDQGCLVFSETVPAAIGGRRLSADFTFSSLYVPG